MLFEAFQESIFEISVMTNWKKMVELLMNSCTFPFHLGSLHIVPAVMLDANLKSSVVTFLDFSPGFHFLPKAETIRNISFPN